MLEVDGRGVSEDENSSSSSSSSSRKTQQQKEGRISWRGQGIEREERERETRETNEHTRVGDKRGEETEGRVTTVAENGSAGVQREGVGGAKVKPNGATLINKNSGEEKEYSKLKKNRIAWWKRR